MTSKQTNNNVTFTSDTTLSNFTHWDAMYYFPIVNITIHPSNSLSRRWYHKLYPDDGITDQYRYCTHATVERITDY